MFQKASFEEAAGKTIRAVKDVGNSVVVSFTDSTFSVIGSRRFYDDIEMELDEEFDLLEHRMDSVLEPLFGVLAEAMESAALEESKKEKEASAQIRKENRRKEYERLKSEFEP